MELIEETKRLYASGVKQKDISVILGISKKTIYRYLRRSEPTYSSAKVRGSILDEHINKINELFLAVTSSKDILLKIRECGYVGCESLLRTYLSKLKKSKELLNSDNKTDQASKLIKRERLYTIFWKSYDDLTEKNKLILNEVLQSSLQLSKIYQSIQSFRAIISNKDSTALINWINDNIKSDITHIKKFAQSLKKDAVAVRNTLIYEYTNAVLEGHVNRLKNIKRMMYGRANFDLLRQRVLFEI